MNTYNTKTTTEHTNTQGNRTRKEEWRVIAVSPKYEVSNKGRIRNITTGRVLKAYINPRTGYEHVALYIGGTYKTKTVHRLVAIAFIPNPNNLPQVDHRNGCRTRNCVSNLRWCSRKFNNSRKRTKLLKSQNHKSESHINQFVRAELDGDVRYFKNAHKAAEGLGFSHVLAIKALRGELKSAKGWRLEYIDRTSEEGKNANVDVKTKRQKKSEIMKRMRVERKAHVREIGLEPKMAKCVMQINLTGDIVGIYPNVYTAEKVKGLRGILECIFGLRETVGNYKWDWVFG